LKNDPIPQDIVNEFDGVIWIMEFKLSVVTKLHIESLTCNSNAKISQNSVSAWDQHIAASIWRDILRILRRQIICSKEEFQLTRGQFIHRFESRCNVTWLV